MKKRKGGSKNYAGLLSLPIPPEPDLALSSHANPNATNLAHANEAERQKNHSYRRRAALRRRRDEYNQRVAALFAEFGIDPSQKNSHKKLAMALAERHVPGFSVATEQKRGRPEKWGAQKEAELFFSVLDEVRTGLKANAACLAIARREIEHMHPTASNANKRALAKTLRSTLHRRWLIIKDYPLFALAVQRELPEESERALRELYAMLKERGRKT